MADQNPNDTDLLSVSILAGPGTSALLSTLAPALGRAGLLTSAGPDRAFSELIIVEQSADSNPADIAERIRKIAAQRQMDHLFILCEPDRPPMAYASLFANRETALTGTARLARTAFVVNANIFLDAILARATNAGGTCFMAEQMEFVDEIIFEDGGSSDDLKLARSIALTLNPRAEVWPLNHEIVERWRDSSVSSPGLGTALQTAGWRQLLDGKDSHLNSAPGITAFHYSASRPFHPKRFWEFLQQESLPVFRAKGFFWLASRMDEVGGLNLAGSELHCATAGTWWAAQDSETREKEMPEQTRQYWKEPFGDRRQTFAVMALNTNCDVLRSHLDSCLLDGPEMANGPEKWRDFPDPFPTWTHHHAHTHSHEHEHDAHCDHHHHDSEEHQCCHH